MNRYGSAIGRVRSSFFHPWTKTSKRLKKVFQRIANGPAEIQLRQRVRLRSRRNESTATNLSKGFLPEERLVGGYINLINRRDRKDALETELSRFGLLQSVTRFNAIREPNGALGCAKSHIGLLESLVQENPHVEAFLVCEDDLEFKSTREKFWNTVFEFLDNPILDVLCVANHTLGPRLKYSPHIDVASGIQTTACYLVKVDSVGYLLDSFRTSEVLLKSKRSPEIAAIDMNWKRLQREKLIFCIPTEKLAQQRKSFSDIEKRVTDYGV